MTKEELIELSDLNREDNVKYISSEAQGIAIALDSDIYSPTLCKLERAYICGRRKSENRIAELEKENAELKEKLEESEKLRDFWKESSFDWRHKFFEKGSTKRLVKKSKRLTKAKEIIKNCLRLWNDVMTEENVKALIIEAEQFLNSEVEK